MAPPKAENQPAFNPVHLAGWVRVRMEDQKRENRIGSASKVIIAVAVVASITILPVTILHVALILFQVDPIDDVLMVIL